MVCRECNNLLGTRVDSYLTNHVIVKMVRESEGIKSKSGKDVHALEGNLTSNDGDLYKIKYLSPNKIVPELIPVPIETKTGFRIKIDSSAPETGLDVARKKLKRMRKADGSKYAKEEIERLVDSAKFGQVEEKEISFTLDADINKSLYALSFIKIAYEYSCELFNDEYYDDPKAKQLRNFLNTAIHSNRSSEKEPIPWNALKNSIKLFNADILQEIYNKYAQYFPKKIRHMILLATIAEDKAVCQIMLFCKSCTSATVLISDNARLLPELHERRILITVIFEDGTAW